MLLIAPEINAVLLLDFITLCFLTLSLLIGIKIAFKWDVLATTPEQYLLEKKSYLVSTIIKYTFVIKLMVFPYFVMTMDLVSAKIPGAMCATGVFSASIYGHYVLGIKLITLFYFGLWLAIHHFDVRHEDSPYTQGKFKLLILICFIFMLEMGLELAMFKDIDPGKIVSCCGTLFGGSTVSTMSDMLTDPNTTMTVFYGSIIFLVMSYLLRFPLLYLLSCVSVLVSSIISLIYFFSSYVYELPVHKCPFCLIQSDYNYMGYGVYLLLFGGAFSGVYYGLLKYMIEDDVLVLKRISFGLLMAYVGVVTYYPVAYYLKHGVWLW